LRQNTSQSKAIFFEPAPRDATPAFAMGKLFQYYPPLWIPAVISGTGNSAWNLGPASVSIRKNRRSLNGKHQASRQS
jgi:hypothetical protein